MRWMRIVLPDLPPREANPNSHSHHYTINKVRAKQHEEMIAYVLEQGRPDTPMERAHITITWRAKDKRTRDADNLFAAMKGSIDGLVKAGVLVDDSAKYLSYSLYYEWGDDITENETIIEIEEVVDEVQVHPNRHCSGCQCRSVPSDSHYLEG